MVFYHGQKEWTFREVQDHFSTSGQGLEAYIPKFTTCFTDLVRIDDNEIESVTNEALRATLLTQKYSKNSQELEKQIIRIFNCFTTTSDRNYIEVLVVYIMTILDLDTPRIIEITEGINRPMKQVIMSTYDLFIKEGIEKGLAKGLEKGSANEKIEVIVRGAEAGLSTDILSNITNLTLAEVEEIIQHHSA